MSDTGNNKPSSPNTPSASTGKGSYLVSLEKAKEDRKVKLWHSRLAFTKKGHTFMQSKLFSEAAVVYEKYLKILEMIFECPPGQLNPDHFKESARTAELSVVTSVYWDLLRIYDTSDAYGDRQKRVAIQSAKFAPLTPIFPDLLRKAQIFQKQCRHPEVLKLFITSASNERPRCFIATSAFESPHATEVQIKLFTALGQIVQEPINMEVQQQNYLVDLSNLTSGVYFIDVIYNNQKITAKLQF